MTGQLDADRLIAACGDDSADAGITIRTDLEPLGGDGAPVKPASYAGGEFQHGRRWLGAGPERAVEYILVIDNEPSQANRLEAALFAHRDGLGLPDIELDLSGIGSLPVHLPSSISIYQFPHRNADAYLRDGDLDGVAFPKTEIGAAIFAATAYHADALLAWCPQAPLFGFWQSHLGKKRSQAKKARSWTSEIIGVAPAAADVRRLGLKGDPLNLSVSDAVAFDENDLLGGWELTSKGKKLADVGHGQVPIGGSDAAAAGVSFREVLQQATVSFASLRTVQTSVGSAEARAVLVALGLVGHVAAFGRSFHLRSGAELRPRSTSWRWLGAGGGDEELEVPDFDTAAALLEHCAARAEAVGLEVGSHWPEHRLVLQPAQRLVDAITKSWPVA
jgi:CRISPR-associated protein Csb1